MDYIKDTDLYRISNSYTLISNRHRPLNLLPNNPVLLLTLKILPAPPPPKILLLLSSPSPSSFNSSSTGGPTGPTLYL